LNDQWIDFAYTHILTNMGSILFNTAFAPMMGLEPNQASITAGNKYLNEYLPLVENQLSESTYLCGSEMNLADIAMLASMEPFEFIKFDINSYPHIVKWRNTLMAQGFYQKVHKHYASELPAQV